MNLNKDNTNGYSSTNLYNDLKNCFDTLEKYYHFGLQILSSLKHCKIVGRLDFAFECNQNRPELIPGIT